MQNVEGERDSESGSPTFAVQQRAPLGLHLGDYALFSILGQPLHSSQNLNSSALHLIEVRISILSYR